MEGIFSLVKLTSLAKDPSWDADLTGSVASTVDASIIQNLTAFTYSDKIIPDAAFSFGS
jgi:hypothetical protein